MDHSLTGLDNFYEYFRIGGMGHVAVGMVLGTLVLNCWP